ncbi:MAG TPA: DNA-formamidopyrimidine glycosylase family protein [Polyangiales bacterium]|nr:DNA-formamidopyrimidine glycosylase family protein [Polyangiales bacterium]
MAERPDLEYAVPILQQQLQQRRIVSVSAPKPIVLRVAVKGDAPTLLKDQVFATVERRAHFVVFGFAAPQLEMVIAPMLAGRFVFAEGKLPRDTAVSWTLDDDRVLVYRDDVQMGKVYIIERGAWQVVPGLEKVGIDVLSKAFTPARLIELAKKRRDQVRVFLMDKSALDAFGNAYADEALWEAQIHPKTMVNKLTPEDLERLHRGIVRVMRHAVDTVKEKKPPLDEKLRDFLKVRNKHGEKCPRCGDTIRRAGVHGHDTFFCPTCQPETRKTGIVSWK